MRKPIHDYIFRPIDGQWIETKENAGVLADFLLERGILIDDRTAFARLYDYDEGLCYYYRATAGKIMITIWKIGE